MLPPQSPQEPAPGEVVRQANLLVEVFVTLAQDGCQHCDYYNLSSIYMGECMSGHTAREDNNRAAVSKIQDVDTVKAKLKVARDRINNFINLKNRDIAVIEGKISQKVPEYQQTGNKKKLVPLLRAKKDLLAMVDNADVRLKLVQSKLAEVEMQKVNIDTINALDEANQYVKVLQAELEKKDWQNVLDEAKNKYEMEWPDVDEGLQKDPAFQAMWDELGGNKIPSKREASVSIANTNRVPSTLSNRQVYA